MTFLSSLDVAVKRGEQFWPSLLQVYYAPIAGNVVQRTNEHMLDVFKMYMKGVSRLEKE